MAIADLKKACETYVEQTKLLVTLASAFLVAPAAVFGFVRTEKGVIVVSAPQVRLLIWAEILWVFSVVSGYVVLGTVAGSQQNGTYDVYRKATRVSSLLQLGAYLIGLVLFVLLVVNIVTRKQSSSEADNRAQTFERRLRCRELASSYVKTHTDTRATASVERVDFSVARNSCLASTLESRGSGTAETFMDYKVIDLLSGNILFAGSCSNSDRSADFCGNGRSAALGRDRDKTLGGAIDSKGTD